jgi:hypothetical protein
VLINSQISIAIKNAYDKYEIKEISIFEIEKVKKYFSCVQIKTKGHREFSFTIKCPLCSEIHSYKYNINEFLKREVVIGGCETLGIPLFYIGNESKVHERIDKVNDQKSDIIAMI